MVVLELVLLGLIFEVLSGGKGAPVLAWPVNFILGCVLLVLLPVVYFLFRKKHLVKWLSGIPAAISAITFFAFVVLLLGFIPQDNPHAGNMIRLIGLDHVKRSWLMMVSGMYFLVTLGFVALRRMRPMNLKNIGFLLNHAGLWIIIAAGYLGAGDLQRMNITLAEGHDFTNKAVDQKNGKMAEMPFSVRLEDFYIDQYNPKMGLLDKRTGKLYNEGENAVVSVEAGAVPGILDWNFEVLEYLPDALRTGGKYFSADSTGSAPAAKIRGVNSSTGDTVTGWISCGSYRVMYQHLDLGSHYMLVMLFPEARKYASDVTIKTPDGESGTMTLEVNKPHKIAGWKLYQLSYDEQMGKWSRISILEAVRDPWLPAVYTGAFLLLAGAVYLFLKGRENKET